MCVSMYISDLYANLPDNPSLHQFNIMSKLGSIFLCYLWILADEPWEVTTIQMLNLSFRKQIWESIWYVTQMFRFTEQKSSLPRAVPLFIYALLNNEIKGHTQNIHYKFCIKKNNIRFVQQLDPMKNSHTDISCTEIDF